MIKTKLIVVIGVLLALMISGTVCTNKDTVIHTAPGSTAATSNSAGNKVSSKEGNAVKNYAHIGTYNTVRDIVNHPAFQGFGRFILPLDRGTYDENMKLTRVSSLLSFHGHVNPDAVVSAINYMIDEVSDGETIFYDFYSQ